MSLPETDGYALEVWQARAACRGPHASVFFPPPQFERKDEKAAREEQAKTICATFGLTPLVVDLTGGMFSTGQLYVALSRCTSMSKLGVGVALKAAGCIDHASIP